MLGAAFGASTAAGAALLLYTTSGFLGTAGFLVALTLAALALGLWVGGERGMRRAWYGMVVAYLLAAIFATLWARQVGLRQSGIGGALAVLFLLAEPAYAAGAAFASLGRARSPAVAAFLGAAFGVLLAALVLIPRLQPGVILVSAAVALLTVALVASTRAPEQMNAKDFSLNGKRALVTGVGERGQVGFAVARTLVDAGARVAITSLSGDIDTFAAELGADTVAVRADLLEEAEVARLIETAAESLGGIDILVNLAGGLRVIKPLAETSAEEWQREIARNAESTFLVTRTALPHLRSARGAVVNFASPAGLRAVGQLGAYSAAKAAVVAFTRALAIEEKPHGVRVNAVAPGMIDTEHNRQSAANPDRVKWVSRQEVANTVRFLASDAASGISGETIHVLGEGI